LSAASERACASAWVAAHGDALHEARPALPDELDDRGQDIGEPLLAIADLGGGEWPARTRTACVVLRSGSDEIEEDIGVELLGDIESAFGTDAS
jgi:putative DNA primase/helicase